MTRAQRNVGDAPGVDEPRPIGRWPVGQPIPAVATDRDLMALLHLGHSQFYKRKARGHFAFLELSPQLPDSNTRYSGHRITRWLQGSLGDLMSAPAAPRRFFGKARGVTPRSVGRPRKPRPDQGDAR